MSRILKRPMFRKGGSVDEGIITVGRKKYEDAGPVKQDYERRLGILTEAAGKGSSPKQDLYDMLIQGGLNLVSGTGAGKGTLGSIAESFKKPTAQFLQKRPGEEAYQRQLKLAAATGALGAEDARKLAAVKNKTGNRLQKDYSPERVWTDTYAKLTDPKAYNALSGTVQQRYPEAFAEFAAYIGPAIQKNEKIKSSFLGTIPLEKGDKVDKDKMILGGIYFDPKRKKLYQKDNEGNIFTIDPYTGKIIK